MKRKKKCIRITVVGMFRSCTSIVGSRSDAVETEVNETTYFMKFIFAFYFKAKQQGKRRREEETESGKKEQILRNNKNKQDEIIRGNQELRSTCAVHNHSCFSLPLSVFFLFRNLCMPSFFNSFAALMAFWHLCECSSV